MSLEKIEMNQLPSALRVTFHRSSRESHQGRSIYRARSFAGRLDQLAGIRSFVREIAGEARLDSERTYNLELVVSEASANAIEHGSPPGDVDLLAVLGDGRLTFTVSHPGCFRPRAGDCPTRRYRGMGMPLMLALTDEVVVSHPPGQGTKVSLSLWLR